MFLMLIFSHLILGSIVQPSFGQDTKSWEVEYSLREIRTATIRQAPSAHHSVADLQWKMAVQSFTT